MTKIIQRPPIVVLLGHVDHGKSSILEAIKDLKITEKESGGITQHIGAYEIEHKNRKITFIDTPGHEAFSKMRSRGAKIADIAILVVAADEGVKEQTKEAIKYIKEYHLPLIVALNKMDKIGADPERVKDELEREGINLEKRGGDVPVVQLSAKTKEGIEDLLDVIEILGEMIDLKADIEANPKGEIIETLLDAKKGPLVTAIIKEGILKLGDIIATESAFGKVRSLEDFQGKRIEEAEPSKPVLILGFNSLPLVGETFQKLSTLKEAEELQKGEKKNFILNKKIGKEGQKNLKLILKTDVLGSLEAIEQSLQKIKTGGIGLHILRGEVGNITENDLRDAEQFNALIIAYRVKIPKNLRELSSQKKIRILEVDIIYKLLEKIEEILKKLSGPQVIEEEIGKIKILGIFGKSKEKQIIGGRVIEGEIRKFKEFKILREEEVIGKGRIINLQKNKKDVDKIEKGSECGLLVEADQEIERGDILSVFEKKKVEKI